MEKAALALRLRLEFSLHPIILRNDTRQKTWSAFEDDEYSKYRHEPTLQFSRFREDVLHRTLLDQSYLTTSCSSPVGNSHYRHHHITPS